MTISGCTRLSAVQPDISTQQRLKLCAAAADMGWLEYPAVGVVAACHIIISHPSSPTHIDVLY